MDAIGMQVLPDDYFQVTCPACEAVDSISLSAQVRRILAAFLGLGEGDEFDAVLLDQMTPELIFGLDMVAAELLELGRTNEAIHALRAPLIRPAH